VSGYRVALLDWLACAARGTREPAAGAARGLGDRVAFAGTAGHVLDFDDTYLPGIAHLSAPTAPAALVVAAELGRSAGDALAAYEEGFEAMGALARAGHPALYDRGWHPTAVCGGVGAAVAAARLLDAPCENAVALALLRSGGLRAAFGSDGKSLQVGLAAASGVRATRLAAAGARAPLEAVARGWAEATGGAYAEPDGDRRAIDENWIKAWPCCLQTHGAIEAAENVRRRAAAGGLDKAPAAGVRSGPTAAAEAGSGTLSTGPRGAAADHLTVTIHPVSLQAAAVGPEPVDGLQAKFSIPYLTAYTLLHGPPVVESFDDVDAATVERARSIEVRTDRSLLESEFILTAGDTVLARVRAALGSPSNPMDAGALRAKVERLAGAELAGALDDLGRPAADLLALAGLDDGG
jgi:2-methylcitrate dehydratase PrpD